MTVTSTTDTDFCRSLPWAIDLLWQGRDGVHVVDDDRRVNLTLSTFGMGGHYEGFKAVLSSKTNGEITRKSFRFDDHMTVRSDRVADYPIGGNHCFMVIDHCGWQWYIAVPAHPEDFTQAIEEWIDTWR